jgi:hypothetical protein
VPPPDWTTSAGPPDDLVLRRFSRQVHTIVRQRRAIVKALRQVQRDDSVQRSNRAGWRLLLATTDGELGHQEALAAPRLA